MKQETTPQSMEDKKYSHGEAYDESDHNKIFIMIKGEKADPENDWRLCQVGNKYNSTHKAHAARIVECWNEHESLKNTCAKWLQIAEEQEAENEALKEAIEILLSDYKESGAHFTNDKGERLVQMEVKESTFNQIQKLISKHS